MLSATILASIVVFLLIVIVLAPRAAGDRAGFHRTAPTVRKPGPYRPWAPAAPPDKVAAPPDKKSSPDDDVPGDAAPGAADPPTRDRPSVYDSMSRLYVSADVDPQITGQLYAYRDNTRDVYAGRTSLSEGRVKAPRYTGYDYGLQEFSSGNPGEVGVDVGPNALSEYQGSALGFNDGIPESWAFPSTPIRDYAVEGEDYTGLDGPVAKGAQFGPGRGKRYPLNVPDHDPLIGADEDDVYSEGGDFTGPDTAEVS